MSRAHGEDELALEWTRLKGYTFSVCFDGEGVGKGSCTRLTGHPDRALLALAALVPPTLIPSGGGPENQPSILTLPGGSRVYDHQCLSTLLRGNRQAIPPKGVPFGGNA